METKRFEIDGKKILIGAAKIIIGGVASFGAGYIVSKYCKLPLSPNDKFLKKTAILLGAVALSGAAGDVASNYIEKQIDSVASITESTSKIIDNLTNNDTKEKTDGGSDEVGEGNDEQSE